MLQPDSHIPTINKLSNKNFLFQIMNQLFDVQY